jgi:molybdopterin molybdotransferase
MSAVPTHVSTEEARAIIFANLSVSKAIESVPCAQALGRVLARPLTSRWSLPNASLSIMDGFALSLLQGANGTRQAHSAPTYEIVGESAAGQPYLNELSPGQAVAISTGALVPYGADAVVAVEETHVEANRLSVRTPLEEYAIAGRFIRPEGSEIAAGQIIVDAGTKLGPSEIAAAAGCGHFTLEVRPRPRISIVTTGSECIEFATSLAPGQIVNSNAFMLRAMVEENGATLNGIFHARDDENEVKSALRQALADSDFVLTCGGISVGEHDLVYKTLVELGVEVLFQKVKIQPGKPLAVSRLGRHLLFSLPGNPASAYLAFELFVRPSLAAFCGQPERTWYRPISTAKLASDVAGDLRRDRYFRAKVSEGIAHPLPQQQSGALLSLVGHNALVVVPAGTRAHAGLDVTAIHVREVIP